MSLHLNAHKDVPSSAEFIRPRLLTKRYRKVHFMAYFRFAHNVISQISSRCWICRNSLLFWSVPPKFFASFASTTESEAERDFLRNPPDVVFMAICSWFHFAKGQSVVICLLDALIIKKKMNGEGKCGVNSVNKTALTYTSRTFPAIVEICAPCVCLMTCLYF